MSTVKPPKSIPPEQYPRKWWSYVDLPCPKHPPVDFHIHAITKSIQTPQKTIKTSHISRKNPQNHPIRTLPQKTAMLRSCPISKAPTREFSDRSEVKNLNRDIVDTYLHASRKSGTTWPNKGVFHTYGRKQNWNISNRWFICLFWNFSFCFSSLDERFQYSVGSDGFWFEREVLPMDEHCLLLEEVNDSLRLKSVACRIETLLSFESDGFLGLKRKLFPLSLKPLWLKWSHTDLGKRFLHQQRTVDQEIWIVLLSSKCDWAFTDSTSWIYRELSLLSTSTQNPDVKQGKRRCYIHQATLHYVWVEPWGNPRQKI